MSTTPRTLTELRRLESRYFVEGWKRRDGRYPNAAKAVEDFLKDYPEATDVKAAILSRGTM